MLDSVCRFPVLFQGVDTDLAGRGDVRMEDFSCEPAFRRSSGEFIGKLEFYFKITAGIWRALRSLYETDDIEHVIFV